jgi:hypothetical protein
LPEGIDWASNNIGKNRPRILKVVSVALNVARAAAASYSKKRSVQRKNLNLGLVGTARCLVLKAKFFRTVAPRIVPYAIDVQDNPAYSMPFELNIAGLFPAFTLDWRGNIITGFCHLRNFWFFATTSNPSASSWNDLP